MLNTHFIALKGSKKFKPRFIGPYKVLNHICPQAYKLALPSSLVELHGVSMCRFCTIIVMVEMGKWFHFLSLLMVPQSEAEHIVRYKISRGKRLIFVSFVGFDINEGVWLSEADLGNA